MNSFIRFKLSLTEDSPTIRPYEEAKWATLSDTLDTPIYHSLLLLEGLHARWIILLNSLTKEELKKEYVHPEHGKRFNLEESIGIYAWHCRHHLAHVKQALPAISGRQCPQGYHAHGRIPPYLQAPR